MNGGRQSRNGRRDEVSSGAGEAFRAALDDPSLLEQRQVSLVDERRCAWCRQEIEATARRDSVFCGKKCRQTAFRFRRRSTFVEAVDRPLRVAYADPPYPGFARSLYGMPEVDHGALVSLLQGFDGWALSTSAAALQNVLPLCPKGARVCAWVKPHGACPLTYGLHNCWEPVIVVPARHERPGRRDWLSALPARGGGKLPGRKPLAFCAWLFSLLGVRPGDDFSDLFPGSGIVSRAFDELCRSGAEDVPSDGCVSDAGVSDGSSLEYFDDASPEALGDASLAAAGDALRGAKK